MQLAVLGGVGTSRLAAAVARAGGLGMVPFGVEPPSERPVGIGFLMPYVPAVASVVEAARGMTTVEFFEGEPRAGLVDAGHTGGALVGWQVGSVDEARAAEAAGCDYVVAQGIEAGGHVRGEHPLDALLQQVISAVNVPVVAAGGIGTAARVRELLDRGADAVRVGTRFLVCPECDTHPTYVEALIAAGAEDTVLTDHFDDGGHWPSKVRVLQRSLGGAIAAGNRATMPPARHTDGDPLTMPCYAGLSVSDVTAVVPAADVVAELVSALD